MAAAVLGSPAVWVGRQRGPWLEISVLDVRVDLSGRPLPTNERVHAVLGGGVAVCVLVGECDIHREGGWVVRVGALLAVAVPAGA